MCAMADLKQRITSDSSCRERSQRMQEVFRKAALEQLRARAEGSLKRANASATGDMDTLLEQQAELARRDREVSAGVDSVQVWRPAVPLALHPRTMSSMPAVHSTESAAGVCAASGLICLTCCADSLVALLASV